MDNSDQQVSEKQPLDAQANWKQIYDSHSAVMYGIISRLTEDEVQAEATMIAAFKQLQRSNAFTAGENGLLPRLMRYTFQFATRYLKEQGTVPKKAESFVETRLIQLLLTEYTSVAEVATVLQVTEEEVRYRLRSEFLKLRKGTNVIAKLLKNSVNQPGMAFRI